MKIVKVIHLVTVGKRWNIVYYLDREEIIHVDRIELDNGEYKELRDRIKVYKYTQNFDSSGGSIIKNEIISMIKDIKLKRGTSPMRPPASVIYQKSLKKNVGKTLCNAKEYIVNNIDELDRGKEEKDIIEGVKIVTAVFKPVFRRYNDNTNKDTFDVVELDIGLLSSTTIEDIKKAKREIYKLAFDVVKESKEYQSYGVPIEFLEISRCVLTNDKRIAIQFTIKGAD